MHIHAKRSLKRRAAEWLLAVSLQAGAACLAFGESPVYDCFEIVPGDLSHIAYSQNKAVDFAIDCMGDRGWMVTQHCPRGFANVTLASKGDVVNDTLFGHGYSSVDSGPSATFTFAFRWQCKINEATTLFHYGWVTLGTTNGALTVLNSAVADAENVAIVGSGETDGAEQTMARPDISLWKASDQGEWMELQEGCIPRDTEGLVIIPRELGGKPVRVIGKYAFDGCPRITDVRIPNSVRTIGERAFDCPQLKTVNLPQTLEEIGPGAFVNCGNLLSLELPMSLSKVGRSAFPSGGALVVHLPRKDAGRLIRIVCSGSDTTSGYFEPPHVTFAEDPTSEEKAAGKFPWPFYLESGRLFVGDINRRPAFPANLAGELKIPAVLAGIPVYGIGDDAFRDCVGLTSVKIASGVQSVGKDAFAACRGIASVEIPVGVTEFAPSTFQGCENIVSATIPGGDRKIYDYLPHADRLRFLSVAKGSVCIGENQFAGCPKLETVTFPQSLLVIGRRAFEGCGELRVVDLPDGLAEVGEYAFAGCNGLQTLKVPGSLSFVGDRAFCDLKCLRALLLETGVRSIGEEAFGWCTDLERIVFPFTLQHVGRMAFAGCNKVRSLDLPEGLMMVEESAFGDSRDVKAITLPSSLAYIGYRAFDFGPATTIRIAKGDARWVEELFADAEIKWEDGQIAECGATRDELTAQANALVAETFTSDFMQGFAALEPGATAVVTISNAQPGLLYSVGVATTIEDLAKAMRDAPQTRATSTGFRLTIVKPAGDSAFFMLAVDEP